MEIKKRCSGNDMVFTVLILVIVLFVSSCDESLLSHKASRGVDCVSTNGVCRDDPLDSEIQIYCLEWGEGNYQDACLEDELCWAVPPVCDAYRQYPEFECFCIGDGFCTEDAGENGDNSPDDCEDTCGNGVCEGGEFCDSTFNDCEGDPRYQCSDLQCNSGTCEPVQEHMCEQSSRCLVSADCGLDGGDGGSSPMFEKPLDRYPGGGGLLSPSPSCICDVVGGNDYPTCVDYTISGCGCLGTDTSCGLGDDCYNCNSNDCLGELMCAFYEYDQSKIHEQGSDYFCASNDDGCDLAIEPKHCNPLPGGGSPVVMKEDPEPFALVGGGGLSPADNYWQCDESLQCTSQSCAGGSYICFNDGASAWKWSGGELGIVLPPTEANCNDGFDNDCDGYFDCDDTDCVTFCPETDCDNLEDDDGDGYVDCEDEDCDGEEGYYGAGEGVCEYGTELSCFDEFDNDRDLTCDNDGCSGYIDDPHTGWPFPPDVDCAGMPWTIEVVQDEYAGDGEVGKYSSLNLDVQDTPYIVYYVGGETEEIRYGRKQLGEWEIDTILVDTVSGLSSALSGGGVLHIVYYQSGGGTHDRLQYVFKNGAIWETETIEEDLASGFPSIALGPGGIPHVSYSGQWGLSNLNYATKINDNWVVEVVDYPGTSGFFSSIAVDSSGRPHIAYLGDNRIRYAVKDGGEWNIETVDLENYGEWPSLELDSSGVPHIAYYDGSGDILRYAVKNGEEWALEIVDDEGGLIVGKYASLDLDSNDNPHIAYKVQMGGDIRYAVKSGSEWNIELIDGERNTGSYASLVLDSDDKPRVTYTPVVPYQVRYAVRTGDQGFGGGEQPTPEEPRGFFSSVWNVIKGLFRI